MITLLESLETPDPLQAWVEQIAAHARTSIGKAWVRRQAPLYADGYPNVAHWLERYGKRTAEMLTKVIPYIDQHRPNDIDDLDVPEAVLRYALPDYVQSLLPLAKNKDVEQWIKQAIPADIQAVSSIEGFFADDDGRMAIHRKVIDYLNDHPPGHADTPVKGILAMMRDPEAHRPRSNMRGLIDTPGFKRWFGNSVVRDKLGHPLVVFRGTRRPGSADDVAGETKLNTVSFTSVPEIASVYASTSGVLGDQEYRKGAFVAPYYLSIQRPVVLDEAKISVADALYALDPAADLIDMPFEEFLRSLEDRETEQGDFEIRKPRRGFFELDWDDIIDRLKRYERKRNADAFADLLGEIEVDSYIIADNFGYTTMAMDRGFDGIIHRDVFGGKGEQALFSLLGKSTEDVPGLEDGWDDDATFINYRPFRQAQIKSVMNSGTFDPQQDHVLEGSNVTQL